MDAARMMALMGELCVALEEAGDHAAAAHVGHAMDLLSKRHGVPVPPGAAPCGDPE